MRGKPTTTLALIAALLCLGATFTKAHERCNPGGAQAPQAVSVTVQATDATCYGNKNGSATAIADGTGPYAYLWSNGKTTQTINNLIAGIYGVTVTDSDGTMDSTVVEIEQPDAIVVYANCIHTCPGECEGVADLVVSGGTAPYTFDWTGPNGFEASTEDLDELCAGLYWVTVTDANGCQKIRGTVVSEVAGPGCAPDTVCDLSTTVVITADTNCDDSICNGLVELNVSGGAAQYDIVWSNLQVGSTLDGLCAGNYGFTVTDLNGCTASGLAQVGCETVVPCDVSVGIQTTSYPCIATACLGTASAIAVGGDGPYSYAWSNGAATADIGALCVGGYAVTVTDANGCTASSEGQVVCVVDSCAGFSATAMSSNDTNCSDSICNGAIALGIDGGTAPFTVLWSTGNAGGELSELCPDVYSYTVTDAIGCTATGLVEVGCDTVINPCLGFSATPMATFDTNCDDSICNGAVVLGIDGGAAPYVVTWSNAMEGGELANLCPGEYGYTVVDANGCSINGLVEVGCIPVTPCNFEASSNVIADVGCGDGICTGAIYGMVNGGAGPYTFLWNSGATASNIGGLCEGVYSYTVTDAAGCTASDTASVTCVAAAPCVFPVAVSVINDDCADAFCNGSIELTVQSENLPLIFTWSNGSDQNVLTFLCADVYTVTVTDALGCLYLDSISVGCDTIVNPCAGVAITATEIVTNDNSCNGGICDGTVQLVDIVGGTAPYSVIWENGSTALLAQGLCSGFYMYTITDANGCTGSSSAFVNCELVEDSCLGFAATVQNFADSDCADSICNGAIIATTTGGVGPFTYSWSNGANSELIEGLCVGEYFLTVTDSLGCAVTTSAEIGCVVECSMVVSNSGNIDSNCDDGICDGNIFTEVIGGTAPYAYAWSNGSTEESLLNICAGTYTFTVTDAEGCTYTSEFIVLECSSPCELAASVGGQPDELCGDSICNGSLFVGGVIGGNGPVTYLWSNGETTAQITGLCAGSFTYTITDSTGCTFSDSAEAWCLPPCIGFGTDEFITPVSNCSLLCDGAISLEPFNGPGPYGVEWSNGATTATITDLCVGTYTYMVTDANGCTISDSITVGCLQPCLLVVAYTPVNDGLCSDSLCDGAIFASGINGTAPYAFAWNTGATDSSLTNLCEGIYTVTVTDAAGCSNSSELIVIECVDDSVPPCLLTVSVETVLDDSNCDDSDCDGFIALNITTPDPYTVIWSNGLTNEFIEVCPGVHSYTVTSSLGCALSDSVEVGCTPANCTLDLMVFATVNDLICEDAICDGSIDLAITSNFFAPLSYAWSNGSTDEDVINLCAGLYAVTVTDAEGCTGSLDLIEISCASDSCFGFIATATSTPVSNCFGICDGTATYSYTGGTGPVTAVWTTGSTDVTATGLCAAQYAVFLTDSLGCASSVDVVVGCVPSCTTEIVLETSGALCDGSMVQVFIAGDGGPIPTYTDYLWSNGSTDAFIEVADSGTYCVTVHTVNGNCEGVACITIDPISLEGFILPLDESCAGLCNGAADFVVTSGVEPYDYTWDNGEFGPAVQNLCPGVYCVTVTDANQCTLEACALIMGPELLEVTVATQNDDDCEDIFCTGAATASVTGGIPPYSYFWSTGEDTESIDSVCALLDQTLLVLDANGCSVETTFDIFCIGIIGIGEENNGDNGLVDMQSPASVKVSPNPFNESTAIAFTVANDTHVTLSLYDVTGRLIATLYDGDAKAHQTQNVKFTGAAGNGLFVYRLTTADQTLTGNIVQMK